MKLNINTLTAVATGLVKPLSPFPFLLSHQ
ncbi:hypothetical protein FHR96_003663 [Halomonas organivorans]|uniref:Uncharacterized protein n=1 Tax=Halomonas organivorans TaxID=257772 RepID=A0A7W5C184_9GAMM|nr:hypothetical protein [Halomonas organivorans]